MYTQLILALAYCITSK